MSSFDNIDREALAYGGIERRRQITAVAIALFILPFLFARDLSSTFFFFLLIYGFVIAPLTIYFALQGNSIRIKEIKERNLDPDEEKETIDLMLSDQRGFGLWKVFTGRFLIYYFAIGFVSFFRFSWGGVGRLLTLRHNWNSFSGWVLSML